MSRPQPQTPGSRPPPPKPARPAARPPADNGIVREEVYENCRGSCLFGVARFSAYSLLPTDLPPWSTLTGAPVIDRMSFPVPAGWEWVNDWSVDHRGDVDADGWAYAVSFRSREFSGVCTQAHYVCRRVWVRLRRRIPDANIDPAQASALADSALILSIPTLVRACTLDRQKLDAVQSALTQLASPKDSVVIPPYSVEAILNELEFDKSKLAAVKILLPMLDREGLVAALFQIGFHSNRLELLTEVEPDSFLHAHLTVT